MVCFTFLRVTWTNGGRSIKKLIMSPVRRRKFKIWRRQLTNRISYVFKESTAEETRSLDTFCAHNLYDSSEILNVTEELHGEIEIFHTDSIVLDCNQEESHLDNDLRIDVYL
jgi:hypothetical protein